MTTPHIPSSQLRVGDRERGESAERLSAHAAAGRLGMDELEQRLERAAAAVDATDLDALEADLPRPARPRPRAGGRPPALPLAALAVCLVTTVVASIAVGHPILPLFLIAVLLSRRGIHLRPMRWSR